MSGQNGQATTVLSRLRQPVGQKRRPHQLVGGVPQVSLLPGEVREAGAVAAHRRKLVVVVVIAAILAVGSIAAAQGVASGSQARLVAAQARSQTLGSQVAKFNDVRALEQQIMVGKAAVKVGSSTLIDWRAQIDAIEADMPSGYTVTSVSANGATPFASYPQGLTALEPVRVATIAMQVTTSSFDDRFSTWLRLLRSVPTYADVAADTNLDRTTGTYTIDLTMHLNAKAISAGAWKATP
jgi:hypothetical protein